MVFFPGLHPVKQVAFIPCTELIPVRLEDSDLQMTAVGTVDGALGTMYFIQPYFLSISS